MKDFWVAIAMVITIVLTIALCRWMFNAVMAADIPAWVKYMILR